MSATPEEVRVQKYWAIATAISILAICTWFTIWSYCSYAYVDTEGKLAKAQWAQLDQRIGRLEAFAQDLKVTIDIKKRVDP